MINKVNLSISSQIANSTIGAARNFIYKYYNNFKMGSNGKSGSYCIYCGFPNVKKINLEKQEWDTPRSLTAQIAGSGVSSSGGHSNSNKVSLSTYFCMRCKMTEARGTIKPGTIELTDINGYNLEVIIPESLLRFFGSIGLQETDIEIAIRSIARRLNQIIKKFVKTGINPCKKGKIGLKAKMTVGNTKVDVYVLVDNNSTGKYVRIVYGGGWSYCK